MKYCFAECLVMHHLKQRLHRAFNLFKAQDQRRETNAEQIRASKIGNYPNVCLGAADGVSFRVSK